jgi:hypothetical protein
VPLEEGDTFLDTGEAFVDLDDCLCDFTVRRHDGAVSLRQRRGEFAFGRRLVTPRQEGAAAETDDIVLDVSRMVRLGLSDRLPEEVAAAPNPVPRSWQEKLKNGLISGITQSVSTMFCYGLQHDISDCVLEGIVEHWSDLGDVDLIERCADAAVSIAHMAAGHFVGTFHLSVHRAIGPWINRCLDARSFRPVGARSARLVADLDLEADEAIFGTAVCAYAVHEHIVESAGDDRLLELAANVPDGTASFLNGLILISVGTAVTDPEVLAEKDLDRRLERLRSQFKFYLDAPSEVGLLPTGDVLVGPMLADIGGLVFTVLAGPRLLASVREASETGAVPVIGMELFLAAWFGAVRRALGR